MDVILSFWRPIWIAIVASYEASVEEPFGALVVFFATCAATFLTCSFAILCVAILRILWKWGS